MFIGMYVYIFFTQTLSGTLRYLYKDLDDGTSLHIVLKEDKEWKEQSYFLPP